MRVNCSRSERSRAPSEFTPWTPKTSRRTDPGCRPRQVEVTSSTDRSGTSPPSSGLARAADSDALLQAHQDGHQTDATRQGREGLADNGPERPTAVQRV